MGLTTVTNGSFYQTKATLLLIWRKAIFGK